MLFCVRLLGAVCLIARSCHARKAIFEEHLDVSNEHHARVWGGAMDPTAAERKISMPTQAVPRHDEYRCVFHRFEEEMAMNSIIPRPSDFQRVHHMTMYACKDKITDNLQVDVALDTDGRTKIFSCRDWDEVIDEHCTVAMGYDGMMMVQAKKLHPDQALQMPSDKEIGLWLPKSYGIRVGKNSPHPWALLQVHNNLPMKKDNSGFDVQLTTAPITHDVSQLMLACGSGGIPAGSTNFKVSCNKQWQHAETGRGIQVHYHFHSTGTQILFQIKKPDGSIRSSHTYHVLKDSQNQHFKQGELEIQKGDTMHHQCTYNTMTRTQTTFFGSRAVDEMCNVFVVYAIPRRKNVVEELLSESVDAAA